MDKCGICYQSTKYKTECCHIFCKTCLIKLSMHASGSMYVSGRYPCPYCRRTISIPYYKTRAMKNISSVIKKTKELRELCERAVTIDEVEKCQNKTLAYIWKNRIIYRRNKIFVHVIRKTVRELYSEYKFYGRTPPPLLKRFYYF